MAPTGWSSERGVVLSDVTKAFGDEFDSKLVVRDCSFKAEDGRLTVLIGPSGCGKTTLINLIAGYERPTSGRITCDGKDVLGADAGSLGAVPGDLAVSLDERAPERDVRPERTGTTRKRRKKRTGPSRQSRIA